MEQIAATSQAVNADQGSAVPFPPSWFDHMIDLLERLPGPIWLYYLLAWIVPVSAIVLVKWADGTYTPPYVNAFHVVLASNVAYLLAVVSFLDRVARKALATFRPASTLTDDQAKVVEYHLTTMPARPALVWAVIFFVIGLLWEGSVAFAVYESPGIDAIIGPLLRSLHLFTSPVSDVIDGAVMLASFTLAGVLVYHTYHQLRVVDDLYRRHTHINLFYLRPIYGFSRLTVFTSIALLAQSYVLPASVPGFLTDPVASLSMRIALVVQISIVAIVVFVSPLIGIHLLLAEEKQKLLASSAKKVEAAIAQFDNLLDSGKLNDMSLMKDTMEGLATRQKFIDDIPTWPWSRDTSRLLITAVTLPIILWIVQYVVQRLVESFVR
jgi:hypothetical protein